MRRQKSRTIEWTEPPLARVVSQLAVKVRGATVGAWPGCQRRSVTLDVRPQARMNNPRKLTITIRALVIMIVVLIGLLVFSFGQMAELKDRNEVLKEQAYTLGSRAGVMQASRDFRDGKLRLYVIAGERPFERYSGTNDGPFEVWFPESDGGYGVEVMVSAYNDRMRFMHTHPTKFLNATNTIEK